MPETKVETPLENTQASQQESVTAKNPSIVDRFKGILGALGNAAKSAESISSIPTPEPPTSQTASKPESEGHNPNS